MVFVGNPPLSPFRPECDEVHISCAFTWDLVEAERLKGAWGQCYPVVRLGGPAYKSSKGQFIPGMYIRQGVTFTTRGCNNNCSFCLVPEYEGRLTIIPGFHVGNVIQDNNLLQAPLSHIDSVFNMLRTQHDIQLSGGLEASRINEVLVQNLRSLRLKQLFLSCDVRADVIYLRCAMKLLSPYFSRNVVRCYVLIGRNESIGTATERLEEVWEAGAMPFAQLYQSPDAYKLYSTEWRNLARTWSRPAIMKALHRASP